MASTQDHLPISDIHDDVVLLKDGSLAVVLQTSAVNFGLLSENEQLAIISSFAGLLNSLSFMIQIVIRSKKLDISTYLNSLEAAKVKQTNPLLSQMISRYKTFIQNTVAENDVLDKSFYIVVPVSGLELGLGKSGQNDFKKALTILLPRRDNIIRQLSRIGLSAKQLTNEQLIRLYYDIYNESTQPTVVSNPTQPVIANPEGVKQSEPKVEIASSPPAPRNDIPPSSIQPPISVPQPPVNPYPQTPVYQAPQPKAEAPSTQRRSPYIVEELPEDYGTI